MNRKRIVAVIVVILVGIGSYWAYLTYLSSHGNVIQATGTIEATTFDLSAKNSGNIQSLSVDEGDSVQEGQLVAALSRNDLVAQKERDTMALLEAQAKLNDLLAGARSQEINEAIANFNSARTSYEKALADLQRQEGLFSQGAVSQEAVERYQVNANLAEEQVKAAEASLSLLQAGNRPNVIETARAEVERSKAVLKASDSLVQDLKLYAPVSGVVLSKNYEKGEFVQAGAPIVTVGDLNHLWIKVYIPTDDLPAIKLGQKVHFTISGSAQEFAGVVEEIASKGEFTPKTIQTKKERTNVVFGVKIRTSSQGGVLKPGMPADVTFDRR